MMPLMSPSVIVLVVHEYGIFNLERKGESPVLVDPHGPVSFHLALQRVQSPARERHVCGRFRTVEAGQLQTQPLRVRRLNSGFTTRLKIDLKVPMSEGFDH